MKKYIVIILMLFVCIFYLNTNVNATEINSDFEYYNITYDFLNDNEYYVTYTFKPNKTIHSKIYFGDEYVYLDTIEHNLDDFELVNTAIKNYADIRFSLNENKEYYLKYKGSFKGSFGTLYGICLKSISMIPKKNVCDNSTSLSVYSFKLNINHPENIKLSKDKINGIDNLILVKDEDSFSFIAGEKYEKNRYYDVTIFKKFISKSDIENYKKNLNYKINLFVIAFIIVLVVIINKIVKKD